MKTLDIKHKAVLFWLFQFVVVIGSSIVALIMTYKNFVESFLSVSLVSLLIWILSWSITFILYIFPPPVSFFKNYLFWFLYLIFPGYLLFFWWTLFSPPENGLNLWLLNGVALLMQVIASALYVRRKQRQLPEAFFSSIPRPFIWFELIQHFCLWFWMIGISMASSVFLPWWD